MGSIIKDYTESNSEDSSISKSDSEDIIRDAKVGKKCTVF